MNAIQSKPVNATGAQPPDFKSIKARQKATWESGDFGEVAKYVMPSAEELMARLSIERGSAVLDVACGNGNLAVIAARNGCDVKGVDIAANLIAQARQRARDEGLSIEFTQGDAEALPYPDASFDVVVSMYGAMFAPRPELVAAEFYRVTKPGGFIAMANWTPEGFLGKMFEVFQVHLPPPPAGVPSTMLWGDETTARARLKAFSEVHCARRVATMRYPFSPDETVEFFRKYYGPTQKAFDALSEKQQAALRADLVKFQTMHNTAKEANQTEALSEYLEVVAVR